MPSVVTKMQGLSLDEVSTHPQPDSPDDTDSEVETRPSTPRQQQLARPLRVYVLPLPTLEECRASRRQCMYFGFYAGEDALGRALISHFPEQLGDREPWDLSFLTIAIDLFRGVTGRRDLNLQIAYVSQKAKDRIPSIKEDVGECAIIVGLFQLEREAYANRITQEGSDAIREVLGTPPVWWEIAERLRRY